MSRALVIIATMAAALAIMAVVPAVRAAGETSTVIVISEPEPITVGSSAQISVQLTTSGGIAVVEEPIALRIGDVTIGRRWTDAAGLVAFNVPRTLVAAEYDVVASYAGDTTYLASTATGRLSVLPYELTVQTVPPLGGIAFDLDGTRFVSGDDGVATISVERTGEHRLTVLAGQYEHESRRIEFRRWGIEAFVPTITVEVPSQTPIQVGFEVLHQVSQRFVDPDGTAIDPGRVTSFSLRSTLGTVTEYPDGRPRWLPASRPVRRPSGLQSVPVRYILERVDVDGQNVVNTGQQRYRLEPDDEWEVELLLFTAQLLPRDALFGFPVGDAVEVSHPNGEIVRIPLGDRGVTARWLARGIYRVSVPDAPGWSPVTPFALSRDQDVPLRVITYLDMAVVGLAAAGLALGLLHVGRPHLIPRTVRVAGNGLATLRDPRAIAAMVSRRQRAPTITGTSAAGLSPSSATAAPPIREFVLPHPRWSSLPSPDALAERSASSGTGPPLRALGTGPGQPAADDVAAVMAVLRPTHQPPPEAASTPEPRGQTRSTAKLAPTSNAEPALTPSARRVRKSGAKPESTSGRKSSGTRTPTERKATDAPTSRAPKAKRASPAQTTPANATTIAESAAKGERARPKAQPSRAKAGSKTEQKARGGGRLPSAASAKGRSAGRVGGPALPRAPKQPGPSKRSAGNGEARPVTAASKDRPKSGRGTPRALAERSIRVRVAAVEDADRLQTWLEAIGIPQPASLPTSTSGEAPETAPAEGPEQVMAPGAYQDANAPGEPNCPGCGVTLTTAARFCRRCGRDLSRDRLLQREGAAR